MPCVVAALLLAVLPARAEAIRPDALDALPGGARIVFLGEVHDNPHHHRNQARAVAATGPSALVFEMLSPAQAARVTPDLIADAAALAEALDWAEGGWPEFAMYHPIFDAAPQARIYGAAVPRSAFADLDGDPAQVVRLAETLGRVDLSASLPAEQAAARAALQDRAHCGMLPDDVLPILVDAQRLRDARLAEMALRALEQTGGPVVVITGNGHARTDWGAPAMVAAEAPGIAVVSVGQFEAAPGAEAPFDLWLVTDAVDRPDPCAGFRAAPEGSG